MAWSNRQLLEAIEVYHDQCEEQGEVTSLLRHLNASGWEPHKTFQDRTLTLDQTMIRPALYSFAVGCKRHGRNPVWDVNHQRMFQVHSGINPNVVDAVLRQQVRTEVHYEIERMADEATAVVYCPEGVALVWAADHRAAGWARRNNLNALAATVWPGYPHDTFFTVYGGHKLEKWFWERLPTVATEAVRSLSNGAPSWVWI